MLTFCDSFVPYGNILSRWNLAISIGTGLAFGRGGRYGAILPQSGPGTLSKTLIPTSAGVVGFANFNNGSIGGILYSLQCVNGPGTLGTIFQIVLLPDSTIAVYAGGTNELMANPKTPIIYRATWNYFEIKYSLVTDGSPSKLIVPTVSLRLNGNLIVNTVSAAHGYTANIQGDNKGNVHTFGNTSFPSNYLGDLYICDTTGATNNNFLGDVRVGAIFPRADVVTQWTPSSGSSSFNLINEHVPDGDTSFISSNTPGQYSVFFFDHVQSFSGQILGVQFSIYARKTDEGTRIVRHVVGNDAFEGSDIYLGDSYAHWHIPFDVDPVSLAAWTPALLNAQSFGIKLQG